MAEVKQIEESKVALDIMANDDFKLDLTALLKSRYPLFYITTNEERRFLKFMEHYCKVKGYECFIWDCYKGLINLMTQEQVAGTESTARQADNILEYIIQESHSYINNKEGIENKKKEGTRGYIYILLDYFHFIGENVEIERRLKEISNIDGIYTTIITGPFYQTTPVLENLIPFIEFPFPNKQEIKNALWEITNSTLNSIPGIEKKTKKLEEELINSVSGLTLMESQTAFAKSLVRYKGWHMPTILKEKRQIVQKSGILEFCDSSLTIEDVGGLHNLIDWIKSRKECFSVEAEKYGLRKPRGLLTIGASGCVLADTKIRIKKISEEGKYKINEK